jgi:Na+/H+ antiporter NhaD/arsenite permease-like protein
MPTIHPVLVVPFVLLLALIAIMPLTPGRWKHFWEQRYPHVSVGAGLAVGAWYVFGLRGGAIVAHTLHEYTSFICLIGSLFVVAGGIHLRVKGAATPLGNAAFLAFGAVAANVIGTTGASMVLIRPFIRMNKMRISAFHVVFFIFVVSNCGGALTPIGDPPLFLGYLRGVPFFWLTDHVLPQWAATLAALLAAFYCFDRWSFRRAPRGIQERIEAADTWFFQGGANLLFLAAIVGAVFLPPRFFLREIVMVAVAAASYRTTPASVRRENEFTFGPIREVAFLFFGIFLTMMPALGFLDQHGKQLGFTSPAQYYFATGGLSAVLDNAPTYLNFLQLAEASLAGDAPDGGAGEAEGADRTRIAVLLERFPKHIVAVSLGAVFFGAATYIGNGPNFMVKAVAEASRVKMPSFFGYIVRFTVPVLLPILIAGSLFL